MRIFIILSSLQIKDAALIVMKTISLLFKEIAVLLCTTVIISLNVTKKYIAVKVVIITFQQVTITNQIYLQMKVFLAAFIVLAATMMALTSFIFGMTCFWIFGDMPIHLLVFYLFVFSILFPAVCFYIAKDRANYVTIHKSRKSIF